MTGGNLTDFIWKYISQTATLYKLITKFEMETKFATLFLNDRKKAKHFLSKNASKKASKYFKNTSYLQDASKRFQNRFKNATDF